MRTLKVKFENCFGIEKLEHDFDFSDSNVNLVYAKNGSMKTSFAKVFKEIQDGTLNIKEEIFGREAKYEILIDGNKISYNDIYVIKSLDLTIEPNISALLVNNELKKEYEKINNSLEGKLNSLIVKLNKVSGITKNNIINTLLLDFNFEEKNIYNLFQEIKNKNFFEDLGFEQLKYKEIFGDERVLNLLKFPGFKDNIKEYYIKYNEIIKNTPFFEEGKFSLDNIYKLKKSIKNEKLYSVNKNGIFLNDKKYNSYEELEKEVENIMEIIRKDKGLTIVRDKIENGTKSIEKFDSLIKEFGDKVLLNLNNLDKFKKNLWKNYFYIYKNEIEELVNEYEKNITKIKKIIEKAEEEKTQWEEIINKFNTKFHIPFEIDIDDRVNSVLGFKEPNIIFKYYNEKEKIYIEPLTKEGLLNKKVLSGGELRALYLLFILFDIESFKKGIIEDFNNGKDFKEKLFIIDDIADSFDYKNKYAIVEYLRDLSLEEEFYSIILTHNFDFFRFLSSRLKIKEGNKFIVRKNKSNVILNNFSENEPWKRWKSDLNEKNIIALIPFVRNLIEYGKNNKKDYLTLTHLLHIKYSTFYDKNGKILRLNSEGQVIRNNNGSEEIIRHFNESEENGDFKIEETENLKFRDLLEIYKTYLGIENFNSDINLEDNILECLNDIELDENLEDKIIHGIKIRYEAENFMIDKINNSNWIYKISGSQTNELFQKLKGKIKAGDITDINKEKIKTLEKVNIMTPENIHLNSFMYEPILDMDISKLNELYEEVKELNN